MSPSRKETCPKTVVHLPVRKVEFSYPEAKIMSLILKVKERLRGSVDGIQVEADGQTAHFVIQHGDEEVVLIDNGENEAIPCGKQRQKGLFTEGWYYSVDWGGKTGKREYVEAYRKGWGGKGLVIPGEGKYGYFLRTTDLQEVIPEKMADLWTALNRVTNQE